MWLRPASTPGILGLPVSSSRGASSSSPQRSVCWQACNAVEIARIVRLGEPVAHQIDESSGFEFQPALQFSIPLHILTQGTKDQPRIEHALLGIAIQFEETPQ